MAASQQAELRLIAQQGIGVNVEGGVGQRGHVPPQYFDGVALSEKSPQYYSVLFKTNCSRSTNAIASCICISVSFIAVIRMQGRLRLQCLIVSTVLIKQRLCQCMTVPPQTLSRFITLTVSQWLKCRRTRLEPLLRFRLSACRLVL